MKIVLAEPRFIKDSVGIISELVTEARFNITKDAIELVAMDPANVAMVVFKLLSSACVEFKVKEDVDLAINLNNLKQVLRRAGANDTLTLELEESKLKITLKGKATRTFHLPILDLEDNEQKVPDLSFPVSITTDSTTVSEAIEDCDIVAESVAFIADDKTFSVAAQGDLSKAEVNISGGDDTKIVADGRGDKVQSKYSIEYLKKMMQGSKLSDKVTIRLDDNYPLKMEFVTLNKVMMTFILAPRVDND